MEPGANVLAALQVGARATLSDTVPRLARGQFSHSSHNSRVVAYFLGLIALGNHKLHFGCGHQLTISSSIPPRDVGVSTYDTLATFRCNTSLVRRLSASLDAHFDVLPGIGAYNLSFSGFLKPEVVASSSSIFAQHEGR